MAEDARQEMLTLESQVCFALAVASRSVISAYRPVLEPLQLTHPQYLVMLALWEHAPLSVKRLSELLHLDPGTVTPLIKRLEMIGYLRRERDPQDERFLSITLTESGAALRTQALEVPVEMLRRLDMTEDEVVVLRDAMHKVIRAAERAVDE